MGAFTDYAESGLLQHIFRNITFAKPTQIKIGLVSTYTASDLEKGITTSELTGGGYARRTVNADATTWIEPYSSGTAQALHNRQDIKFPESAPFSADIGNVEGVFLTDQSDNVLFYGQLTAARNIRNGDQFVFPSGGLKVTLD